MSDQENTSVTSRPKTVFAKLTTEMSRKQQFKNLKSALEKSGFRVKDDRTTQVN